MSPVKHLPLEYPNPVIFTLFLQIEQFPKVRKGLIHIPTMLVCAIFFIAHSKQYLLITISREIKKSRQRSTNAHQNKQK